MAEFDRLTKPSTWRNALYIGVGFVVPELIRAYVERETSTDLPDEVYGLGTAAAFAYFTSGTMRTYGIGGSAFSVMLKVLERFDFIEPVTIETKG